MLNCVWVGTSKITEVKIKNPHKFLIKIMRVFSNFLVSLSSYSGGEFKPFSENTRESYNKLNKKQPI